MKLPVFFSYITLFVIATAYAIEQESVQTLVGENTGVLDDIKDSAKVPNIDAITVVPPQKRFMRGTLQEEDEIEQKRNLGGYGYGYGRAKHIYTLPAKRTYFVPAKGAYVETEGKPHTTKYTYYRVHKQRYSRSGKGKGGKGSRSSSYYDDDGSSGEGYRYYGGHYKKGYHGW
jgi:hypothetical protein